jgi:hypothetical protein
LAVVDEVARGRLDEEKYDCREKNPKKEAFDEFVTVEFFRKMSHQKIDTAAHYP